MQKLTKTRVLPDIRPDPDPVFQSPDIRYPAPTGFCRILNSEISEKLWYWKLFELLNFLFFNKKKVKAKFTENISAERKLTSNKLITCVLETMSYRKIRHLQFACFTLFHSESDVCLQRQESTTTAYEIMPIQFTKGHQYLMVRSFWDTYFNIIF